MRGDLMPKLKIDLQPNQDLYVQRSAAKQQMRELHWQLEKIERIMSQLRECYLKHWKRYLAADEEIARRERLQYVPEGRGKVPRVTSFIETFKKLTQDQQEDWLRRLREIEEDYVEEEKEEEDA
jgi:hypothetical protein